MIMTDLFGNQQVMTIHYLVWHQPFASLMLHGKKETRPKYTKVRGKVLILSSLIPYSNPSLFEMCGPELMLTISTVLAEEPTKNKLGYAIAIGNLVDCQPMKQDDEEQCFLKYKQGLWKWIFEDVKRIEPFKLKVWNEKKQKMINGGKQGWGLITDPAIVNQIKLIL